MLIRVCSVVFVACFGFSLLAREPDDSSLMKLKAIPGHILTFDEKQEGKPLVRLQFLWTDIDAKQFPNLSGMKHLRMLGFFVSNVSGEVLSKIENTKSLEKIILWGTATYDHHLKHLRKLTKLRHLDLGATKVTDDGLKEHLHHLSNITHLMLYETTVSSNGLKCISQFKKLQVLCLAGTKVSDRNLRLLLNLPSLKSLDLGFTKVTDNGLRAIDPVMGRLQFLYLRDLPLTVKSGPQLKKLANVKIIHLGHERIGDALMVYLKGLRKLEELYLEDTKVGDQGLKHLAGLPSLKKLSFHNGEITDKGLMQLVGLSNLEALSVCYTRITRAGIAKFAKQRPDVAIEFFSR